MRNHLSLATLFVGLHLYVGSATAEPIMYAHFIDVGQADAALLEFPCGTVLIDAGAQDDTIYAEGGFRVTEN